ncbi:MAG: cytochrome c biogenesis protein CcsA [Bacteroidales bacterium]
MKRVIIPTLLAIGVYSSFILLLWSYLGRPPMRTMGETRLLYSLFLIVIGLITWIRSRYNILLIFTFVLSIVFMIINLLKPEIHEKELMPVLNSPWFVPHVVIYMVAYATIACAFVLSIVKLLGINKFKTKNLINHCDKLVYDGMGLLTIGMIMGALWAKQAWGDYWSWDPKEVWASITWMIGVIYIHYRLRDKGNSKSPYILIIILFLCFQICWYGINYLPTAATSVHTYMDMK